MLSIESSFLLQFNTWKNFAGEPWIQETLLKGHFQQFMTACKKNREKLFLIYLGVWYIMRSLFLQTNP